MTTTERQLRIESLHVVRQRTELPGNVYDDAGEIVFSAGAKVNSQLINQIRRRCGRTVCVDQHWPLTNTRSTATDARRSRHTSRRSVENRRTSRQAWHARLRISFRDAGEHKRARCTEVTTRDISAGGMSFLLNAFVYPGTEIEAILAQLPHAPRVRGIVRHCEYVGGEGHHVGIEFTCVGA